MAGTLTVTTADRGGRVTEYQLAWTSDASGDVNSNTFALAAGEILGCKFVPGSGSTQPSDLYDVTLEDSDDVDVLAGVGANVSNSASARSKPLVNTYAPVWTEGDASAELVVQNAGNAKTGTVYVWVRTE